mmetsp:Transcript_5765/g.13572  ORF Transcript_5765/g.13572 Transcript_5765/m.13572 type:complete len:483 (+) Transcript_5765:374-1822(+)
MARPGEALPSCMPCTAFGSTAQTSSVSEGGFASELPEEHDGVSDGVSGASALVPVRPSRRLKTSSSSRSFPSTRSCSSSVPGLAATSRSTSAASRSVLDAASCAARAPESTALHFAEAACATWSSASAEARAASRPFSSRDLSRAMMQTRRLSTMAFSKLLRASGCRAKASGAAAQSDDSNCCWSRYASTPATAAHLASSSMCPQVSCSSGPARTSSEVFLASSTAFSRVTAAEAAASAARASLKAASAATSPSVAEASSMAAASRACAQASRSSACCCAACLIAAQFAAARPRAEVRASRVMPSICTWCTWSGRSPLGSACGKLSTSIWRVSSGYSSNSRIAFVMRSQHVLRLVFFRTSCWTICPTHRRSLLWAPSVPASKAKRVSRVLRNWPTVTEARSVLNSSVWTSLLSLRSGSSPQVPAFTASQSSRTSLSETSPKLPDRRTFRAGSCPSSSCAQAARLICMAPTRAPRARSRSRTP